MSHPSVRRENDIAIQRNAAQEGQTEYAMDRPDVPYHSSLQQQASACCDWINARKGEESIEQAGGYVNLKLKAKHNMQYPEIKVGDQVSIYMRRT